MIKKAKSKEEVVEETVKPKKRVQTAEGWKRAQVAMHKASKAVKSKAA